MTGGTLQPGDGTTALPQCGRCESPQAVNCSTQPPSEAVEAPPLQPLHRSTEQQNCNDEEVRDPEVAGYGRVLGQPEQQALSAGMHGGLGGEIHDALLTARQVPGTAAQFLRQCNTLAACR